MRNDARRVGTGRNGNAERAHDSRGRTEEKEGEAPVGDEQRGSESSRPAGAASQVPATGRPARLPSSNSACPCASRPPPWPGAPRAREQRRRNCSELEIAASVGGATSKPPGLGAVWFVILANAGQNEAHAKTE